MGFADEGAVYIDSTTQIKPLYSFTGPTASGVVLHQLLADLESDGFGSTVASIGQVDGFDGADLELRLAIGEAGAYVLAFSNQAYGTPALFESFGWYYGLELSGVWIVASGFFSSESTTRKLFLPGTDYSLHAWTSQAVLGLVGFSNTVQTTLVP